MDDFAFRSYQGSLRLFPSLHLYFIIERNVDCVYIYYNPHATAQIYTRNQNGLTPNSYLLVHIINDNEKSTTKLQTLCIILCIGSTDTPVFKNTASTQFQLHRYSGESRDYEHM